MRITTDGSLVYTVETKPEVVLQGHMVFTHRGREIARGDLGINLKDVDPKYHGPIIQVAQMMPGASLPLGIFFEPPPEPPPKPSPKGLRRVREGDTGRLSWWGRLRRRMRPPVKAGRLSPAPDRGGQLSGEDV